MGRWLLLSAVAVAAVPVALWAWPSGQEAEFRGSTPPPGLMLPSFALPDQAGRMIDSDDLRGQVVLVTFLETQCTESCPIIGEMIREAFGRLDGGEAVALGISVHPGDDTPAAVRAYLRRHRLRGELHYLVGTEREMRPVWKAFAVLAAVDTHDPNLHSAPVRLYDPEGEWVSTLHAGADLTPENLVNDVRAAAAG